MRDSYGRNIDYMRISITDRCNLRCKYCMPEGIQTCKMDEILTYEEIVTICEIVASLGIRKIKITGGEPLVRKGCTSLIQMIKEIPGIDVVTLTTNGVLLLEKIDELKKANIDAINVSLDSLKRSVFNEITGVDALASVLDGIKECIKRNIPVKINSVLTKDSNAEEWDALVALAKDAPIDVRFIEMMPIGYGKNFTPVSNQELLEQISQRYPNLIKDEKSHGNGPAVYHHIPGYLGSIGFISAIHGKFCDTCNRIRLTATGFMKPCLCYESGSDLRQILRHGTKEQLREEIIHLIEKKPQAHCFDQLDKISEREAMSKIGG